MNQGNELNGVPQPSSAGVLHKPVKVVAVTGGKGGIGKTNIALNLAIALEKMGQHVLLLDADLGLSNVDVLLGLKVKRNLYDVLQGNVSLEDIILRGPAGVHIVPASSGIAAMAELNLYQQSSLINAFSSLSYDVDTMVIDTAAGISGSVLNFTQAAQEVVVVVCNEPTSIADAYALIKILAVEHGIQNFRVLTNMTRTPQEGKTLYNKLRRVTDRFLQVGLQYLGTIPYDDHVRLAVRHQRAVIEEFPGSRVANAINAIAKQVNLWKLPLTVNGRLSFFLERLIRVGDTTKG